MEKRPHHVNGDDHDTRHDLCRNHVSRASIRRLPDGCGHRGLRDGCLANRPAHLRGREPAYYFIQFATLAILVLGANTAYSDFPRLSYFLARDRFMPRQFTFRGDRWPSRLASSPSASWPASGTRRHTGARSTSDPALCGRRLPVVHDQPIRHVHALAKATRTGLEGGPDHQLGRRVRDGAGDTDRGRLEVPGRRLANPRSCS